MLQWLKLRDVGPAPELAVEFAPRVNLVTGDNGLGKSFVLDLAWYCLTGSWARGEAQPVRGEGARPRIEWDRGSSRFEAQTQRWDGSARPHGSITIYGRVDEGFSVFDPLRHLDVDPRQPVIGDQFRLLPAGFHFAVDELWDGLFGERGETHCRGLIADWALWQHARADAFAALTRVLDHLSPAPDHSLTPGDLTRLSLRDVRDHPTLRMPYGQDVALVHASAAIRRVVGLAYLLVWTWREHLAAAKLRGASPSRRMVFLIDEIESHLHPQWQRRILPALVDVMGALAGDDGPTVQLIAVTHSPLVLASAEPFFDEGCDALLHFDLTGGEVRLHRQPWAKQGDITNWLVSHVFGLDEARSIEAERAVEAARAWMEGRTETLPAGLDTVAAIDAELRRVLAGHDDFWPEWLIATKQVRGAQA